MTSPIYKTYTHATYVYYLDLINPIKFNLTKRIDEEVQKVKLTPDDSLGAMRAISNKILQKVTSDLKKKLKEQCEEKFANSDYPEMVNEVDRSIDFIIGHARVDEIERITEILKTRLKTIQVTKFEKKEESSTADAEEGQPS